MNMDDLTARKLQNAYELIKAGKRAQALDILIPLRRANPDLSEVWFLLGHAASDPQEKIRCFQQVLRLDPTDEPAQKQLARLLARQAVVPAGEASPKKQNPAIFWGLAALMGLFICLASVGLWWSFNPRFFSGPAPAATIPVNTAVILPAASLAAATATPEASLTPKPTARPSITLPPTGTPQPSVTIIPTLTLTFTVTPSRTPGPKPKALNGCAVPNGLGAQIAQFKIENIGKTTSTVILKGLSKNGNNAISCQLIVKQGKPALFELMFGNFTYTIFHGSTTFSGSFFINQPNKSTMRISDDKVQIGEFP